ncbi:unnamed protein product [Rotaria magnacalcarata]|uniref:Uncharacterized protein n=1 Tax=Rotaria magnacalcarata TaxID=392030 RepID=A0A815GD61_9BILA|nr:unnamed protein product [Rotaria magnacalcarata]
MFDIDGIYNAQNDRIWAVSREGADKKDGVWQKRKFPQKVPAVSGGRNDRPGYTHVATQEWCQKNFSSFIDKDHWPPNSPDINPLDYSIWDEFGQQINWTKVQSKRL